MFFKRLNKRLTLQKSGTNYRIFFFTFILLVIEFLDEFVGGALQTSWHLIHADLQLSYLQVGMLLSLPSLVGNIIEPIFGILGDVWQRRILILSGGVAFALALLLIALSHNFLSLLIAFILFNPASGAFVSLSQAVLMDVEPSRHEQNMARWTFAGSVGIVVGQLSLSAFLAMGWGWRGLFLALTALTLWILALAWRSPCLKLPTVVGDEQLEPTGFKKGVRNALQALGRREVLLWLTLLQFADLMLDGLGGFLALYFVAVVGVTNAQAGLAVMVWTGVGLIGDLLLIPLLERVRGLIYLRFSALAVLCLFPAFLLVSNVAVKLMILGLLGFLNAGWYSILKGQLYSAMPGQSSTVLTVGNLFGLVGDLIPLGLGMLADWYGLGTSMWLLLLGPLVVLIGVLAKRR